MSLNYAPTEYGNFTIGEIFDILNGTGITKEEIESNPGNLPAIQSGAENNGCIGKISLNYCIEKRYTYTLEPCLTVARSGSAGFVAFHPFGCVAGDSAKILIMKDKNHRNEAAYLFLRTVLLKLQYKYTYGRKVTENKYRNEILSLPICGSKEPDWQYMEALIGRLRHKPIATGVRGPKIHLADTDSWEPFFLHRIMHAGMGNGIDSIQTTSCDPKFNYVSRDSSNNGVVGLVDEIEGETPFPAGSMTLALGGSFLGSCFIQAAPYYTAQNVAVLQEKIPLSNHVKLFLATLIRNECKVKYQAFGRELNSHFRKDFVIKLPVKQDMSGNTVIDSTYEFSDDGYIPDWEWMDRYMHSLPYSDRI